MKDLFCKSYDEVKESGILKYIENIPIENDNGGMIYKVYIDIVFIYRLEVMNWV